MITNNSALADGYIQDWVMLDSRLILHYKSSVGYCATLHTTAGKVESLDASQLEGCPNFTNFTEIKEHFSQSDVEIIQDRSDPKVRFIQRVYIHILGQGKQASFNANLSDSIEVITSNIQTVIPTFKTGNLYFENTTSCMATQATFEVYGYRPREEIYIYSEAENGVSYVRVTPPTRLPTNVPDKSTSQVLVTVFGNIEFTVNPTCITTVKALKDFIQSQTGIQSSEQFKVDPYVNTVFCLVVV